MRLMYAAIEFRDYMKANKNNIFSKDKELINNELESL